MNFTIKEAAQVVNGRVTGDEDLVVSKLSRIEEAEQGDLTFLYHPSYEKYFSTTKASAILVKPGFNKTREDLTYIEVEFPDKAFSKIIIQYYTPELRLKDIDDTAFIHAEAEVGKGVAIGKNVVISAGCRLGNNVKVYHNTVLLENVEIGDDSVLYPNVSIREDCILGKRVIVHPNVVIGSDGFGYNPEESGKYEKIPQIGNVIIEDDVEIGANSTIDRAAVGSTVIKRGTKIDNLVQIAHNVTIGEDTAISAQTGISGSTKIGNRCIMAGQVGVAGHLEICDNVVLMAKAGISKSLKKPGYYFGYPAKELKVSHRLEAHIRNLPDYSERISLLERELKKLQDQLNKNH